MKSTGSGHHLTYRRYYNLVCVMMRSILSCSPHFELFASSTLGHNIKSSAVHIGLTRCPVPLINYPLFRIVAKTNQPDQVIILPTDDTTSSYES
jgi:hypothetical protein